MDMAHIYTNCGEYDKALDEIEYVLSLESEITINLIKFEHWVKPLLNLPRFKALANQYAI